MINTLAIMKVLATLIGTFVAYKGYMRWKETKALSMEYFYKATICLAALTAFMALGGFLYTNLYIAQALLSVGEILAFAMFIYLLPLIAILLGMEEYHRIIFRAMIVMTILTAILYIIFFDKALTLTYPIYGLTGIGVFANVPGFLRIMWGVISSVFVLVLVPLIFSKSIKLEDAFSRKKGIMFSFGLLGLGLAMLGYCFLSPYFGFFTFWKELAQGLICASGQIAYGFGMLLRRPVKEKR